MSNVDKIHEVSRMLHENVFYPPHSPRTESSEYAKIHKHLTHELDLPCLTCGVRNSTLNDPVANWAGAKDIETHHHIIEYSLANAIDLNKFNERIVARLRVGQPEKYAKDFTEQQMLDWIDHDPDNLWVLCDVHHRHLEVGIHSVTYPIWGPQDLIKDGFEYTPTETVGTNTKKGN